MAAPRTMAGGVLPGGEVTPDPALLEAVRADPERARWWFDRVRRCRAALD